MGDMGSADCDVVLTKKGELVASLPMNAEGLRTPSIFMPEYNELMVDLCRM